MKAVVALCVVFAFAAASAAAGKNFGYRDEQDSFGFMMTRNPVFPYSLHSSGVNEGAATFMVLVSASGELEDYLVIAATHEGFARAVESAMRHWNFHPPLIGGEPVRLAQSFTVNFSSSGTIVTSTNSAMIVDMMLNRLNPGSNSIRVYSARELDDFLEPIRTEKPRFHKDYLGDESLVEFTIEFYVDHKGNVRIPVIGAGATEIDGRLTEAAQDALMQWKFIPPKVRGKPVLVRVAQPFKFSRTRDSFSYNGRTRD